ncbi:MAG: helix-turn-helix domain-containing protein, partial [Adlercreutzia sp.]|nr:helix-turn-helix domain-containing protein [Adlercreutzia sp.]
MARQTSFGEALAHARERKGLDLSTAARKLRIRPDILRAIEEGDFARMPPRG